jgi:hypothetical protein
MINNEQKDNNRSTDDLQGLINANSSAFDDSEMVEMGYTVMNPWVSSI